MSLYASRHYPFSDSATICDLCHLHHCSTGSILSPGTVLLILAQNVSYVMTEHFGSSWTETIQWLLVIAATLFVVVTLKCNRKTQVGVAFVATTIFALLMMTVTVGVLKSMAVNKLANLQVRKRRGVGKKLC